MRSIRNTGVARDRGASRIVVGRRDEMTRRFFMGKVIIGATMSLDGFMNDRHGDVSRLYPDMEALQRTEMLQEEIRTTGAVMMGRHAYAMGDPDVIESVYEFQVPIFVLTHTIPAR